MSSEGYELWDICENNHGGNENSVAANKVTRKGMDSLKILRYLGSIPDATCEEVEIALQMKHQTCSARFSDLKLEQAITATDKRPTRSGCMAQAWKVNNEEFTEKKNAE